MLWMTWSMWLPDPGPWWPTRHPGKDCGTLCTLVVGGLSPQRVSVLSVFSIHLFTCTLSPALTPVIQFHCTATTAFIISDCNWRWPRLFILVTLPEGSTAHDGTDFHTQGVQVQPLVCHISCQQSSSPIGSHEIWKPYTVDAVATSAADCVM